MITPSFGLTATERVLPKLALDFTTANLDPRVTFTRSGNTATVTNSSGQVVGINANLPRFDYDPTTLVCKGLLIEEARTNSALNSIFDAATSGTPGTAPTSWTALLATGSQTVANSAYVGGNSISISCATQRQVYSQSVSVLANTTYTWSIWVTSSVATTNLANHFAITSVPAGATTTYYIDGVSTASTTTLPLGRFRLSIVLAVAATAGTCGFRFGVGLSGNTTGTVLFEMPQIEAGAFATSYIPTTTTALTRNADVAVMTGTNFSNWYNAGTGAFNCAVLPKSATGTKPVLQFDDTTAVNTITMQGNATAVELKITTLAVLQSTLSTGTITANTAYGSCGAWTAGSNALSKSGGVATTGSPVSIPTVTQSRLGSDGTNYFNGWLQKINYWPQRLTNSEVQAFSK